MLVELRFEQGLLRLLTADGAQHGGHPVESADLEQFGRWAQRYAQAIAPEIPDDAALLAIGREIRGWLDTHGLEALLADSSERAIRYATGPRPSPEERVFLEVPWELLADDSGFWAQDEFVPYEPARLLGRAAGLPAEPAHADLSMLFMAAAPVGPVELDFEAEEAGILTATQALPVQVVVEESGALEPLANRLALGAPFESLHLSCHGTVMPGGTAVLALEDALGNVDLVNAGRLIESLGPTKPLLAFVSACRTAEHTAVSGPLVQDLVRGQVPNAVGWDGSVHDRDAIAFASVFYGELARRHPVPAAAARARRHLLALKAQGEHSGGHHWPLARVYLGPRGSGALSSPAKSLRPRPVAAHQAFLDLKGQVPVVEPEQFVGRRRETQAILRALGAAPHYAGVIICGMGRLGKSSLAARVASRLPQHRVAVVYGRQPGQYDATAILDKITEVLAPVELRESIRARWASKVVANARLLKDALQEILIGPAAAHDPAQGKAPILLVIDDVERILEHPVPGEQRTRVQAGLREALRAVIEAFDGVRSQTASRLLMTSRYAFSLPSKNGAELAERLHELALLAMNERQREKLVQAQARHQASTSDRAAAQSPAKVHQRLEEPGSQPGAQDQASDRAAQQVVATRALLQRAAVASGGNPGLLALLATPALKPDKHAQAEAAIAAVERYSAQGVAPTEGAVGRFFEQLELDTYLQALTPDEAAQMRAALVFGGFAVPWAVMETAGQAQGVGQSARALERLVGLGCMDAYQRPGKTALDSSARPALAANALARPLYQPLDQSEQQRLAQAVVVPLYQAWADSEGGAPVDARACLLFWLAALASAPSPIIADSARAASTHVWRVCNDARTALGIVEDALAMLDAQQTALDLQLVRVGVECALRLGKAEQADALLERGLALPADDKRAATLLRVVQADRLVQRGETDEALRLWRDEVLPVFEQLGDVCERALIQSRIADVLAERGELDEALRLWRDEVLPVQERHGEVRDRAITQSRIADVLFKRGQLDEALHLWRDEALPVFKRLGDVRQCAIITSKIADVLMVRGKSSEALDIWRNQVLPVYERLPDMRERAITLSKIAQGLRDHGELDKALHLWRDEVLPTFEQLNEARECAVTQSEIAGVWAARGEPDEALRIWCDDVLPIYERLGEVREHTVTLVLIAEVLQQRGELDEALDVYLKCLPVAQHLGDVTLLIGIRYRCATARLEQGVRDNDTLKTVVDELHEAYLLSMQIQRFNMIAASGQLLGRLLFDHGIPEQAAAVLRDVVNAYRILGKQTDADIIQAEIEQAQSANY